MKVFNTWNEQSVPDGLNNIFVFGSNTEGRHGKGAALNARQLFGAKYGQAEGLQGRSYAIITKDLSQYKNFRSIPLSSIKESVSKFYDFAAKNKHLNFYVTKIGCGLAGYKESEIGDLFRSLAFKYPENVFLPKVFVGEINE